MTVGIADRNSGCLTDGIPSPGKAGMLRCIGKKVTADGLSLRCRECANWIRQARSVTSVITRRRHTRGGQAPVSREKTNGKLPLRRLPQAEPCLSLVDFIR